MAGEGWLYLYLTTELEHVGTSATVVMCGENVYFASKENDQRTCLPGIRKAPWAGSGVLDLS